MSIERLAHEGNGMLERNRVNPENMESQCELDTTDFPNGAEVGMIVAVDKAAGKVKLAGAIKGILANSEETPDQFNPGLKNYRVPKGGMGAVLFLEQGNTFTTNTVCYDTTEFANEKALDTALAALATTPLYGKQYATTGAIQITKTAGTCALSVVKPTTMPDGQKAIKFFVIAGKTL